VPFGSDSRVVPSNIILYGDQGPQREGEIWGSEPLVCSDAAYRKISLALIIILYYIILYHNYIILCNLSRLMSTVVEATLSVLSKYTAYVLCFLSPEL